MSADDKQVFLYLTTRGWKTGQPHEIEIWFVEREGRFYLVAEHRLRTHWVQNILHNPAISFRVREQTFTGSGRVIEPDQEPALASAVAALMEAKYEWSEGLIVELTGKRTEV
jgi:deazaflavin-dependent oxidoreductase (nitroreductase family)